MDGRTNGGAYGLVDLLCSPNAHTRKGHRKWMAAFLLKRWINCRAYRGLAPQT